MTLIGTDTSPAPQHKRACWGSHRFLPKCTALEHPLSHYAQSVWFIQPHASFADFPSCAAGARRGVCRDVVWLGHGGGNGASARGLVGLPVTEQAGCVSGGGVGVAGAV